MVNNVINYFYPVNALHLLSLNNSLLGTHYLDHAGTTLYSQQQIADLANDLQSNIYSNPHTSKETEDIIDQVRYLILEHFNAPPDEYSVIFNRGATDGLKTIAECFDFYSSSNPPADPSPVGAFRFLRSCHTSVLGMREVVNTRNISPVEEQVYLEVDKWATSVTAPSLFILPGQCNYNGYRYTLPTLPSNWYTCLDAAALVATSPLCLQTIHPDFVTISFYKMFGHPTGLGALLVSKRGAERIKKQYYGGGTILLATTGSSGHHVKRPNLSDQFEDGTLPFLSIIALLHGFNTIKRLVPPSAKLTTMERIQRHTQDLIKYFYSRLTGMKYSNGRSLVKIHLGGDGTYQDDRQGSVLNFTVLHSDGSYVGHAEFDCMAQLHGVRVRVGCCCNPGACQKALNWTDEDLLRHFKAGHVCGDAVDLVDGQPTGSVRVSVGYMTRKTDIDALLKMLAKCYLNRIERNTGELIHINDQIDYPVTALLEQICVYPVKSCGPFRVFSQWPLVDNGGGLKYDREWMIIKGGSGVAVTQKTDTRLCLIRPLLDLRRSVLRLTVRGGAVDPIEVPLEDGNQETREGSLCSRNSKVCGDRVQGSDCGDAVAEWLDRVLGMEGVRLIRQQEQRFDKQNPESQISLNNSSQFLLINRSSVRWLMDKVDEYEGSMDDDEFVGGILDRFRANLIVSTGEVPLIEKQWRRITLQDNVTLESVGPCTRCQMICIDQDTGDKTTEPLRTIGRVFEGKMRFGVYFHRDKTDKSEIATIKCGSSIRIEED